MNRREFLQASLIVASVAAIGSLPLPKHEMKLPEGEAGQVLVHGQNGDLYWASQGLFLYNDGAWTEVVT